MSKLWEIADWRCNCGHLLMKQAIAKGRVEIKCLSCKRIMTFNTEVIDWTDKNSTAVIPNFSYGETKTN